MNIQEAKDYYRRLPAYENGGRRMVDPIENYYKTTGRAYLGTTNNTKKSYWDSIEIDPSMANLYAVPTYEDGGIIPDGDDTYEPLLDETPTIVKSVNKDALQRYIMRNPRHIMDPENYVADQERASGKINTVQPEAYLTGAGLLKDAMWITENMIEDDDFSGLIAEAIGRALPAGFRRLKNLNKIK